MAGVVVVDDVTEEEVAPDGDVVVVVLGTVDLNSSSCICPVSELLSPIGSWPTKVRWLIFPGLDGPLSTVISAKKVDCIRKSFLVKTSQIEDPFC